MFNTLKFANGASGYILEPSAPPFKRQRTLVRVACAYCREKKLKCSGESEGCQRCLARNIECTYISPSGSPTANSRLPQTAEPTQSDATNVSSQAPATTERPTEVELILWGDNDMWNYTSGLDDAILSPLDKNTGAAVFDSTGMVTPEDATCVTTNATCPSPMFCKRTPVTGVSSCIASDTDTAKSTNRGSPRNTLSHSTPSTRLSEPTFSSCDCINQLLLHNENLNITLFSRPGESEPSVSIFTHGIWRCQKGSMGSCEALLGCDSCSSRSELVVLAITMCDMIMTSIEAVYLQLKGIQLEDNIQLEQILGRNNNTGCSHLTKLSGRAVMGEKTMRNLFPGSGEQQGPRRQSLSRWDVDDDELHIVQSLFNSRVIRLGALLTKVRQITVAKHWPVYEAMNDIIRERLAIVSTNIQEGGS